MTKKKHELSMRKTLPIDKTRVLKALKKQGMTMTTLADEADLMNYRSLLNALKAGKISEYYLDQIAKVLDVPTRYLTGEITPSSILKDYIPTYSTEASWEMVEALGGRECRLLEDILAVNMLDLNIFTEPQQDELYNRVLVTIADYVEELNL